MGPVGHMLQQSHFFAAMVDFDCFCLHSANSVPLHFLTMPFQHVASYVSQIAVYARNKFATTQRSCLEQMHVPDPLLFHQ
eukprot:12118831-Karenia_brevis.AAC.1